VPADLSETRPADGGSRGNVAGMHAQTVALVSAGAREPGNRTRGDDRALVLNATFEPISVVSQRRAMVLVLGGKADSIHQTNRVFRSERFSIQLPSVVRLCYMVKVPFRRRAPLHRRAVFTRDQHVCQYCGAAAEGIDHVVPRSRGGEHIWENVVACCRPCNVRKGDRYLGDIGAMNLNAAPSAPAAMSWVSMSVRSVPTEWGTYLPGVGGLPESA